MTNAVEAGAALVDFAGDPPATTAHLRFVSSSTFVHSPFIIFFGISIAFINSSTFSA